jgi:hypothetical protein
MSNIVSFDDFKKRKKKEKAKSKDKLLAEKISDALEKYGSHSKSKKKKDDE